VAQLLALFKIRKAGCKAAGVQLLVLLAVLDAINSGRFHLASGHIRVVKECRGREMRIVEKRPVIAPAHVIPTGQGECVRG